MGDEQELTPELWEMLEMVVGLRAQFDLRYEYHDETLEKLDQLVRLGLAIFHKSEERGYNIAFEPTAAAYAMIRERKGDSED